MMVPTVLVELCFLNIQGDMAFTRLTGRTNAEVANSGLGC